MCLYPRLIENPKYKPNKKNGGIIPAILDERVTWVPTKCGQCIECKQARAREWGIRLQEDCKTWKNGKFVTLTFSNEKYKELYEMKATKKWPGLMGQTGYGLDNALATRAVRLFTENWRKKYKTSIRHYLITELGHEGTENIHLHGILWTNETFQSIREKWQYGWIWPKPEHEHKNYVSERTINYIMKYITKIDRNHESYKSIMLTSAGIGRNYTNTQNAILNKYKDTNTNEQYTTRTGHKIAMPIYWRNKIYTEEEREKLWIQKLDKQERYVMGEKIKIDKGDEQYWKILKYHRARSKQLGYAGDEIDWEKRIEELYTRNWQHMNRIKAARPN